MLIRQTLLYLPAQLFGPLFQFLAAVVWTHWLAAESYGVLTYVLASQELAFILCLAWWSHYALRYIGTFESAEARTRYQASENGVIAVSALLQVAVSTALLFTLDVPVTGGLVAATVLYCVSRSLTQHLGERARAVGSIGLYTCAQSFGPIAGFALAFLLIARVSATPEAALLGFAGAQLLGLVWLWRRMGLGLRIAGFDPAILRRALLFGTPLIVAGGIAWIALNGIRNVVDYFNGAEAVGLVAVGWGIGQRLASVVAMLVAAASFPLAVKHLQAGARVEALLQLSFGGALLFGLLAPTSVGLVLIGRPLVELLIAEPFRAVTYAVLPLAAVAGAIRNLRIHFADQVMILFEKTHLNIVIATFEAVVTMAFCIAGTILDGPRGATAGCLAGAAVSTIVGFAIGHVRFGLIIPWGAFLRIALATLAMALTLILVPLPAGNLGHIASAVLLGGLVYGATILALFPDILRKVREYGPRLRSALP